jgi:TonB family protein
LSISCGNETGASQREQFSMLYHDRSASMGTGIVSLLLLILAAAQSLQTVAPPPPPPPPPTTPVRIGANIPPPARIKYVAPVYPALARAANIQGAVVVEATIGPDGNVQDVTIARSNPLLDKAALDAVRQWQFAPTRLNGTAVPVIMTVTVNFALELDARPCAGEPSLKSAGGGAAATLEFVNESGAPRKLYWLDSAGARRLFQTIAPGATCTQRSYVNHAWAVTDMQDTCVAIYVPTSATAKAVLRAVAAPK